MDASQATEQVSVFIPVLFIVIGISLFAGIQFITIGLYRRSEPIFLIFGFMCLLAAAFTSSQIAVYRAGTAGEMIAALRQRVVVTCTWFPFFFAFVSFYTNWRRMRPLIGLVSGVYFCFLIINLLLPNTIRLSALREIKLVQLPWGETLNIYSGPAGPWGLIYLSADFFIVLWALARAILLFREGEKKRGAVLGTYCFLQLAAGVYSAFVVDLGGFASFYVDEFAYLGIVIVMSFYLGNELQARSIASERALKRVSQEVMEREQVENALRDSEGKFRSIVQTAPDFILTLDRQGTVLFINRTLPGFKGEDVIGSSGFDYIPPEFHGRLRNAIEQVFETAEVCEFETVGPGPKGLVSWYVNRVGPLLRDSQVVAVTIWSTNVTLRRQADEALSRSEERLRQAQKMEGIGRLAGGVAHDFNNLLTAILGYAKLLQGYIRDDKLRGYVEEIDNAGQRAASLTRQLLAFSRNQVLQPRTLNLNTVVSNMTRLLKRLIREDIELITLLAPELNEVNADPSQIEQVIMNLVVNAGDAMPDGGKLTIETANAQIGGASGAEFGGVPPGSYVTLSVTDTGAGMDADTKSRIFEPFFTTKEEGKGTGLGLSTVYGIVTQSGGQIVVDSEAGYGTTFTIYLPKVDRIVTVEKPALAAAPSWRGSETILLVEDDRSVRDFADNVLRHYGYSVLTASSGTEALALCPQQPDPIDLLLTDVVMPRMSGRQLAAGLKTLYPDVRVLYISGYPGDELVSGNGDEPDVDLLRKPFSPEELVSRVRQALDRISLVERDNA